MDWEDGVSKKGVIESPKDGNVILRGKFLEGKIIKNSKDNNVKYEVKDSVKGFDIITFNVSKGETYTIL